ncbi:hypothetical protein [Streptomyces albidoflavus]|uniref:hypothetical protein n=1 Tax=Streptomyces albidoflavus TaxID=1886 RepID=UPI0010227108|nr:hypothetical protein [Streptomyces albidoflavus]WTC33812.1 hypothetical protein OH749_31570 [Streptomyces albidoflavus]
MAPHRDISPDDCPNCRKVFAALEDHQIAASEIWLTTEEIGKIVGLKKRATQDHLAHLFGQGRIDADRRTPLVSGIGQPLLTGAQEWATNIVTPDPTCARCLVALAGIGWEGQIKMEDLAKAAGVSLRTAERHRPHLVNADLVAFAPVPVQTHDGKTYGRRPDRFTLMSAIPAPRLEGAAWEAAPARAEAILDRVRWFVNVEPEERALAVRSVAWCLRNGWPEEPLLKALDASLNRRAYRPGGYLSKLLRKLPTEYIVPAREMHTGRSAPRVVDCPVCRNAFRTTLPGTPLCGGGFCHEAGRGSAPAAPVFKIA